MKLVSFEAAGHRGFGVVEGDSVVDLTAVATDIVTAAVTGVTVPADAPRIALSALTFLPVIPDPRKIICVGLNYQTHITETGRSDSDYPAIFTRFADSQTGHLQPLIKPRATDRFDYEGELALVIGKPGRAIPREDALAHVAGYSCYNEGSTRNYQRHTHQFTPGKNFPLTAGFGPWLVTADEIPDPQTLRLRTILNDVVVQDASTADMIFRVDEIIAYVSSFTALAAGDVIVTGTPGGVGDRRDPPLYMWAGDTVRVEISGIGTLENTVIDEA